MATCDPQALVTAGKCFSLSCISRDSQVVAELELLRRWAGFTGTVRELLDAGKCFSRSCLSEDAQVVAELQLYCDIANAAPVVCFTLDMSSTPSLGASNGTATATPVGGVGPFTYSWNNGATTQTITGLDGDTAWHCDVTDTRAPACIVGGDVTVASTTLIYSGGSADPQLDQWTVTGHLYQSGNDVYASLDTSSINVTTVNLDGQFTLAGLGTSLTNLFVENTSVPTFDLTGCSALHDLDLNFSSALVSIDLSECSGLAFCNIRFCPLLTSLNTQNLTTLRALECDNNPSLAFLNIENCSALYGVMAGQCALTTLMVFNNPLLGSVSGYIVDFGNNNLDAANVNGFLVYFDGLGTTAPLPSGDIYLQGGTNAAPSGAGATAATAILGRGWNLNTN